MLPPCHKYIDLCHIDNKAHHTHTRPHTPTYIDDWLGNEHLEMPMNSSVVVAVVVDNDAGLM